MSSDDAGAFLKAGHPTTVWNRTSSKAGPLVAEGARLAPTAGDAVRASPLTIICLTDYPAVRELLGASESELFKAMADRAIAAGHGGEQYPVLIEEFSRPGGD
ncbi:NAD(P)-binding domain-containing protein [Nonomuraea bangladeshensis]|uniref:NAD(P)-binding domain-containing protein n=1 Tax=Nonomuraea bangladeshensis TaxID=404385 RepID=A0ABV3H1E3_9ACTN